MVTNNKILLITQARVGSKRFPGKILKKIKGTSLLEIHLERLKMTNVIDEIMVATSNRCENNLILEIAKKCNVQVFRGSENDVLDRFYNASLYKNFKWIVRVTSDCPLIDANLIDKIVNKVVVEDIDYGSNTLKPTFPDGQDIEVIKFDALCKAWKKANLKSEREHVTPYIKKNSDYFGKKIFKAISIENKIDYSKIRMTVDEKIDLKAIKVLINNIGTSNDWKTYTNYIMNNEKLFNNQSILRNEGYIKSLKED